MKCGCGWAIVSEADGDMVCESRRVWGQRWGESFMAVEGPTEQVPEGTHEPPKASSSRSLQEDATLPTHMVPELTLEAFSLSEVPAQRKATRLLPTSVKLFIHMPPHAIWPSSSPKKGKAGRSSRVNSLVKAEGTEGRLCLQES